MSEHSQYLTETIDVARTAGGIIKEAFANRTKHVDLKNANDADLVTQTDTKVEALIFSTLRQKYPSHKFVGEESVSASEDKKTGIADDDVPTWVIDPVDGTTNFVHGFPFVAVCIALVLNRVPIVGVVYNPILDEMFHAVRGQGAKLNDTPLPLPPTLPLPSLATALVATEYGSDRQPSILTPKFNALHKVVASPVRGVRSMGSAALTMCYVAKGVLDAYWEAGVHAWDVAASTVILREAGGLVVNWEKQEKGTDGTEFYDICSRNVVCVRKTANPEDAANIAQTIRDALEECAYARD